MLFAVIKTILVARSANKKMECARDGFSAWSAVGISLGANYKLEIRVFIPLALQRGDTIWICVCVRRFCWEKEWRAIFPFCVAPVLSHSDGILGYYFLPLFRYDKRFLVPLLERRQFLSFHKVYKVRTWDFQHLRTFVAFAFYMLCCLCTVNFENCFIAHLITNW